MKFILGNLTCEELGRVIGAKVLQISSTDDGDVEVEVEGDLSPGQRRQLEVALGKPIKEER